MGKIIRFYQSVDGKTPVKDFLDSLPGTVALKILWVRILCFHGGGSVLVLTNGFMKKTQKTPAKEIERAETCKGDFLRRHKRHE